MIPQKRILPARRSGYRFTHWLLGACFLAGSAITGTATAAVTVLATNQGSPGNIIVDTSRVYWIDFNTAAVSSVDKLSSGGSSVLVNSPAAVADTTYVADLVQDTSFLYFLRSEASGNSIFKASKTSTSVSRIVDEQAEADSLGINNGILFFYSDQQWENTAQKWDGIPGTGFPNFDRRIGRVSTQGGSITTVLSSAVSSININPVYFDTDGTYLNWSDLNLQAIARIGFLGGSVLEPVTGISSPWALTTMSSNAGPASGYIFWTQGLSAPQYLKRVKPGGVPLTLLSGISDPLYRCFVQEGSFVYCAMANGTIVSVPLDGGTATVVVTATDAAGPRGLTSDGTYLFWTASNGSIRRIVLPVTNFKITTNVSPVGGGVAEFGGFYTSGTIANLKATPYTGYTFKNWTEGATIVSNTSTYSFTVTGNRTLTANFTSNSTTVPSAPTANAATNVTNSGFTANWSDVSGATGYRLDVSTGSSFGTFVSGYQNLDVGNTASRNVTGLSASTIYYYRVRAYNSAGTSANSNTVSVTTTSTTTVPSAPTVKAATNVTSSGFTANWSSVSGATGYRLDVSSSSSFSTFVSGYQNLDVGNAISRNVTGLSASTIYYYRVRSYNSAGTSGNSNTISVTTLALQPPVAPTASAATSVTGSGFTAHWSSVSNATGYLLDVSTSSSFASHTTWNAGNVTSRSMSGLSASTIYYYRVRAYNAAGTSGNSNVISVMTLALQPPLAPTATAVTNLASSGFTGNWSSVSGATGYRLDVSTSNSFSSYVSGYQSLNVGNVFSKSVSGLSASKAYYYRVRAYNGAGTSGNSNVISVTTSSITLAQMLSPSPGPPGSTFTSSTVTFSWTAGVSVTQYFLYLGNSLGTNDIYGASQGLNHSVTVSNNPTDGRTIYVRLWSMINGAWYYLDYTYKAFKVSAPNLTPYQPSGWSNKIVTTHTYGSTTDTSSLVATSPIYIDLAVINNGVSNITTGFQTNLYVDNLLRISFTTSSLSVNSWGSYIGWSIGLLSPGSHTIKITTDSTNQVSESNEGDNTYSKTISVN